MLRKAHFRFSIMMTTIRTTNHILELSLKQWSLFLTNYDQWLCEFIQESNLPYSFLKLNVLGETLIRNSLNGVQQVRSLYLNEVQKRDIWGAKDQFRNHVHRIISKENSVTASMAQLEANVLPVIKDWIVKKRPIIYREDEPWKVYINRQIELKGSDPNYESLSLRGEKDSLDPLVFTD